MANFVLLYHGAGMAQSPEEIASVTHAWGEWFAKLGGAVVDPGNPASGSRTITGNGAVSDDSDGPTGYSIIKADSLDQAVELAKGCPVLGGGASVQVVETFAAM